MPGRFKSLSAQLCARTVGAERRLTNLRTTFSSAGRKAAARADVRRCAAARPARSDSRSSSAAVTARRVRSDRARDEPMASEDRRLFLSVVLSLPPERTTPSAFVDRSRGRRQGLRPKRYVSRKRELVHAAAVSGVVRCVVARVIEIGREECQSRRSSIVGARSKVCADTFAQEARSPASDDARTFSSFDGVAGRPSRAVPRAECEDAKSVVFRLPGPTPCVSGLESTPPSPVGTPIKSAACGPLGRFARMTL